MTEFDVMNNSLTALGPELFQGLPALKKVFFSYNKIATIDRNTFASLPALTTVILTNNELTVLDPTLLSRSPLLKSLYVAKKQNTHILDKLGYVFSRDSQTTTLKRSE